MATATAKPAKGPAKTAKPEKPAAAEEPKTGAATEAETPESKDLKADWTNVETKEGIYDQIHQMMLRGCRATTDKRVVAPKSMGRTLFVTALEGLFHLVLTQGAIALPAGYGSVFLKGVRPRHQRTPQGKELDVPARWALRINAGTKVEEVMKQMPPPEVSETEEEGASDEAPATETPKKE